MAVSTLLLTSDNSVDENNRHVWCYLKEGRVPFGRGVRCLRSRSQGRWISRAQYLSDLPGRSGIGVPGFHTSGKGWMGPANRERQQRAGPVSMLSRASILTRGKTTSGLQGHRHAPALGTGSLLDCLQGILATCIVVCTGYS
jgi:hypothetical protein